MRLQRIPVGGLCALYRAVADAWVPPIVPQNATDLTRYQFDSHAGRMFAGFYVTAPQGRIGGICALMVDDAHELLTENLALSTAFKTNSAFGFQPVIMSSLSRQMVEVYMEMRQRIVERTGTTVKALFLTYDGLADESIGRRVTAFFKDKLNLHITTTTIRSMVETSADSLRCLSLIHI